jgi:glycerol-3-phosphate dehydrogenase (NAD(P)+)
MSDTSEQLCIVGGGSFGTALSTLAGGLGHHVHLWVRRQEQADEINDRHTNERAAPGYRLPDGVQATTSMQDAVGRAKVVIVAIPSKAFRETSRALGEFVTGEHVLVHATKGLDVETFQRMSQILRQETCALKVGVISGPNLAAEILAGQPAGALIASRFDEVITAVQAFFRGGLLRLYGGKDVVGTEIGGAFKNIIALAAGVIDGLGLGDNTRSLLVTRGLSEMAVLGVSMGADVFTFGGLAGIGDLMATCNSKLSRNHKAGEQLAAGQSLEHILATMGHVVEGVPTTQAVHRYAQRAKLDLPIVRTVHAVLYEHLTPRDGLAQLMALPVGTELAALRFR